MLRWIISEQARRTVNKLAAAGTSRQGINLADFAALLDPANPRRPVPRGAAAKV
jgi:hypothetical protein